MRADVAGAQRVRDIVQLTKSLDRVVAELARPTLKSTRNGHPNGHHHIPTESAAKAIRLYRMRRERDALFGAKSNLFGEPAWDILLDLFIAHDAGRDICVTSACTAAFVPNTTGLRCIAILESKGLIEKVPDTFDGRRTFVRITATAVEMMEKFLSKQP